MHRIRRCLMSCALVAATLLCGVGTAMAQRPVHVWYDDSPFESQRDAARTDFRRAEREVVRAEERAAGFEDARINNWLEQAHAELDEAARIFRREGSVRRFYGALEDAEQLAERAEARAEDLMRELRRLHDEAHVAVAYAERAVRGGRWSTARQLLGQAQDHRDAGDRDLDRGRYVSARHSFTMALHLAETVQDLERNHHRHDDDDHRRRDRDDWEDRDRHDRGRRGGTVSHPGRGHDDDHDRRRGRGYL